MAVTIEMACSSLFSPRLVPVCPPAPARLSHSHFRRLAPSSRRILRVSFSRRRRRRRRLLRRRATTIFPSSLTWIFFLPQHPHPYMHTLSFLLLPFITIVRRHPISAVCSTLSKRIIFLTYILGRAGDGLVEDVRLKITCYKFREIRDCVSSEGREGRLEP